MKKNLLGLFAVVLAIAFVAFTAPPKENQVTLYRFTYDVTEGFAEAEVETDDKDHWGTGCSSCKQH